MSTTSMLPSNPNKMYKNSFHGRRRDSGELDVFEAARYFSSAANDQTPVHKHHAHRRSLDMPMMRSNPIPHHIMIMDHDHHHHQNQVITENKKFKLPSSPGGRLASFLNSLFNQSHSKKKKKKPKSGSTTTTRDFEDESPGGGRRKRRSSISHFLSSSHDKKSSNLYANTPIKSCKIITDRDQGVSAGPKNGKNYKITLLDELHADTWIQDKILLKNSNSNMNKYSELEDEGADSDSSSDLFDLPNHDLDFLSSGLPVYGTTHMDTIKNIIAAPIS